MVNIFVGAAIILVPLGVFLFIMARDLSFEEKSLTQRVEKLQRAYYNLKSRAQAGGKIVDHIDLDDGDTKLIKNIAAKLRVGDNQSGDLTSAIYKAMRIRDGELKTLNGKIRIFKKYSIMIMVLICVSLGFLLFISSQ